MDVVRLLAKQLLIDIPEQLEKERLLNLDRVRYGTTHLVQHEFELATLHIRLIVVAEEVKDY